MKKPLLLIINILIISQLSFSQSTTILPNRLSVPNVSANGTCDNSSKGSTVFNTSDNKMYYCNGTNWQEMTGGGFTLPYTATQASGFPLLKLKNTTNVGIYGESTTATGVVGQSGSSYGVYGISDSNFGGFFASSTGYALGVLGKMNINNTTGSTGSLLSIDSFNKPVWQDPVAFCVKDFVGGLLGVLNNTVTKLAFSSELYDLGNNYNPQTRQFYAPVSGVYHFEAFATWKAHTNGSGIVAIILYVNGIENYRVISNPVSAKDLTTTLSTDVLLAGNEVVEVRAFQTSGVSQIIDNDSKLTRFIGRLVIRQ